MPIREPVLWKDNDDLPIADPAEDHEGDHVWWDGVRNMALYPLSKVLDLGHLVRTVGEIARVVETPSSSSFKIRNAVTPFDAE